MSRIEVDGMDELMEMLNKMTISESDERKAMQLAIEPVREAVEKNTPIDTGKAKSSVKAKVSRKQGEIIGTVFIDELYLRHQEYGTSRQNKNVGFFARAVRASKDEALRLLKDNLIKR